jgi:hypothetical protein
VTWLLLTGVGLVAEMVLIVALASGATARDDAETWQQPAEGGGATDRAEPPAVDPRPDREPGDAPAEVRLGLAG